LPFQRTHADPRLRGSGNSARDPLSTAIAISLHHNPKNSDYLTERLKDCVATRLLRHGGSDWPQKRS
jgi:hypothetical protein